MPPMPAKNSTTLKGLGPGFRRQPSKLTAWHWSTMSCHAKRQLIGNCHQPKASFQFVLPFCCGTSKSLAAYKEGTLHCNASCFECPLLFRSAGCWLKASRFMLFALFLTRTSRTLKAIYLIGVLMAYGRQQDFVVLVVPRVLHVPTCLLWQHSPFLIVDDRNPAKPDMCVCIFIYMYSTTRTPVLLV